VIRLGSFDGAILGGRPEQGSRTVTRSFPASSGTDTQYEMSGLPTGVVSFSARAFDVGCSSASPGASPGWISDVVSVQIAPTVVAKVTLTMRRNGKASVGVDWTQEPPQPAVYEAFGYPTNERLREKRGGVGFSGAWVGGGFNATIHDNYLIETDSLVYPRLAVAGGRVQSASQPAISGLSRALTQTAYGLYVPR
jgi:hypothetical protein